MKENKRMLDRAARKIERERTKIEGQEQKHIKEIQKLAKAGQHVSANAFIARIVELTDCSKPPRSSRRM